MVKHSYMYLNEPQRTLALLCFHAFAHFSLSSFLQHRLFRCFFSILYICMILFYLFLLSLSCPSSSSRSLQSMFSCPALLHSAVAFKPLVLKCVCVSASPVVVLPPPPPSPPPLLFSEADVSFITGVWQRRAERTSVCHPLMGLGSLQGVHNTSERVAFSFCLPQRRKRPITLPPRFQSTVQFHFTSASVPRIGSGTYGQIPRPVDLIGIDQTLPGSHTVLALIRPQLSIAIYSLGVRPSNPFWVNPAFWRWPIDLLSAGL